jgi:mevalonate kinase
MEIETCGKWILTGEHTVLRGGAALVFPLKSKRVRLRYKLSESGELSIRCSGSYGNEASLIIWDILTRACQWLQISRSLLRGEIEIECEVPLGAGLGASAALVCAVTTWLSTLYPLTESELFEFSKSIEDIFHGESSGVDIAVSLRRSPLVFKKDKAFSDLKVGWKPNLVLTYSGQKGITRESVGRVKDMFVRNPTLAQELDSKMKDSVLFAQKGLESERALPDLVKALDLGYQCFEGWGLIPDPSVKKQVEVLRQAGALAVKPTGSGMGGYILSLWGDEPLPHVKKAILERSEILGAEIIPCFN